MPKPQARERRKNRWILEDTWRLVNKRISAQRKPAKYQTLIWRLSQAITESLKGDRRRRVETSRAEVEKILGADPPIPREAWQWLKGWYKATVDCAPPLAWDTFERITAERVDLYSYVPSPGMNIPIYIKPVLVDDSVPTEDEIEGVVKNL